MPVKLIIDLSDATDEEIEQFHNNGRETELLEMVHNARKYDFEFVQLADKPTATSYYAKQSSSTDSVLKFGRSTNDGPVIEMTADEAMTAGVRQLPDAKK